VFRFWFYNSPATVDAQFMARPLRVEYRGRDPQLETHAQAVSFTGKRSVLEAHSWIAARVSAKSDCDRT
jgi:hypothetical protein